GHGSVNQDREDYHEPANIVEEMEAGGIGHG
ncbi:MAG: hypothetical protein CG437_1605, partial [Methanosaeta sp. NSP1]